VGLPLLGFAWIGDRALAAGRRFSRYLPALERVTGALLLLGGLATVLPTARAMWRVGDGSTPGLAETALSAGRPTLLAFHSPSCPVCQKMAPRVNELERDCVGKHMGVVRVDVAQPEGLRLATRLGVTQVPTFMFLGADHDSEAILVGEHALDALRAAAARTLRAVCGAVAPDATTFGAKLSAPRAPDTAQASCSTTPSAEAGARQTTCSG
jgi:thiol-disulfide isomerase/thioredoxin